MNTVGSCSAGCASAKISTFGRRTRVAAFQRGEGNQEWQQEASSDSSQGSRAFHLPRIPPPLPGQGKFHKERGMCGFFDPAALLDAFAGPLYGANSNHWGAGHEITICPRIARSAKSSSRAQATRTVTGAGWFDINKLVTFNGTNNRSSAISAKRMIEEGSPGVPHFISGPFMPPYWLRQR